MQHVPGLTGARRLIWKYPHWWAVTVCAAAWASLFARWASGRHAHGFALVDWMLMVGAMMLPLVFDHLRVAAARSLWTRRHRAMAAFLCGYAAVSVLSGIVLSWIVRALGIPLHGAASAPVAAAAFAFAAIWQITPHKRRALMACHRTVPLAPSGWRAHRDCLQYGWFVGRSCLISCGGLMVACVLVGHALPAMIVATTVTAAERVSVRADGRTTFAALAAMAALQLVLN